MIGINEAGTMPYENLDGVSFKKRLEETKGAVILDVRTPGEVMGGTLPGAKNVDLMSPAFKEEVMKLDKAKEYFLICRSGARSSQACTWMAMQGYKVRNLDGGIFAWPG